MLRSLASAILVVGLYFVGPVDALHVLPAWARFVLAGAILTAITTWQIRAIFLSPYPGLRAVEALAITAPLYLILFAATYFLMSVDDAATFTAAGLTRIDTLYFTVTTFSTVGFGDITAASQGARLLVTVQMLLNLLVLGAGIRLLVAAVQRTRLSRRTEASD
jgi:voltage-gated potassium channel Kch